VEQNEKSRKKRRPQKVRAKEEHTMVDFTGDQPMGSSSRGEQSFPDEWISIAAYYIWKSDGQPEGRDAEYWERAKAELTQLQNEGNLPVGLRTLDEER
jgi:Protein of unknown function (DUF2934)